MRIRVIKNGCACLESLVLGRCLCCFWALHDGSGPIVLHMSLRECACADGDVEGQGKRGGEEWYHLCLCCGQMGPAQLSWAVCKETDLPGAAGRVLAHLCPILGRVQPAFIDTMGKQAVVPLQQHCYQSAHALPSCMLPESCICPWPCVAVPFQR